MHYFEARQKEEERRLGLAVYITDTLMLAGKNQYIDKRWIETLYPEPDDGRTGDEIAAEVIRRAGLRLKGGDDK